MIARLRESGIRAVGSLGFCVLLLLAGPGRLPAPAQDSASPPFPASVHSGWPAPSEPASFTGSFPICRLLPAELDDHERWMGSADVGTDAPLRLGLGSQRPIGTTLSAAFSLRATDRVPWTRPCPTLQLLSPDSSKHERRMTAAHLTMDAPQQLGVAEAELPRWAFLEDHRLLLSTLISITAVGGVMANSLIGYDKNHSFQIHHEGWFGADTTNGGADKASHLTDYFVVASLFGDIYRMLGYSENAAALWGFGLAVATGFANEVSDGFTRHGFSPEDLAMDAAGAATASAISVSHTKDLFGMRTSHLPSDTYTHDVYSADFKLSGLGQRLGVNLGPLRWLLFSVTYGSKGYRVKPPIEEQRQIGLEIGLNLQAILFDVGVSRSTWWGYGLHLIADNVRFPFTAVGMRYDLNHGKWHGPNTGNYD